jgi:hypothetical protein
MTDRRRRAPPPEVPVTEPAPAEWLAEDRASLVGQRFGIRRAYWRRATREQPGAYVIELGHPEQEGER